MLPKQRQLQQLPCDSSETTTLYVTAGQLQESNMTNLLPANHNQHTLAAHNTTQSNQSHNVPSS